MQLQDKSGKIINPATKEDFENIVIPAQESSSSVGGGNNTYSVMQGDFSVVANNAAKTITLTWITSPAPFTLSAVHVVAGSCKRIRSGVVYNVPLTTVSVSSLTITFSDAEDFATGDVIALILIGPDKAYNATLNQQQVIQKYFPAHLTGSTSTTETNAYTAGDVVGGLITIQNCSRMNGGGGVIMGITLSVQHSSNVIKDVTKQRFRVHVYDTLPTNVPADDAAFQYLNENISSYLGFIDFAQADSLATGSQVTQCFIDNINKFFICASSATSLYFIITDTCGWNPTTAGTTTFTVTLRINQI